MLCYRSNLLTYIIDTPIWENTEKHILFFKNWLI